MAYYNGNNVAAQIFESNFGSGGPGQTYPGFSYAGTSENDTILGSDHLEQGRFWGGLFYTDIVYGNDTLNGAGGNDGIDGQAGNDVISGGEGNDSITGGLGNDALNGNMGDDALAGSDGDDTVRGGQGNDGLLGGGGNDFMSGDAGNDVMAGGAGADTFNFGTGFGIDGVQDFNRSEGDSVRIETGSYSVSQVGADTVITMSDGSTMTLANTTYSSLDAGWIHS